MVSLRTNQGKKKGYYVLVGSIKLLVFFFTQKPNIYFGIWSNRTNKFKKKKIEKKPNLHIFSSFFFDWFDDFSTCPY